MFEKSLEIFTQFRKQEFTVNGQITTYASELYHRITQVKWLYERVHSIHEYIRKNQSEGPNANLFEMEIMTESFYHFAWRIIEITKKGNDFKTIPRCVIYDIRNHLIQHVEGAEKRGEAKSTVMFTNGGENGPIIKPYIGPENSIEDKGFFLNVDEFESLLNDTLQELINVA